ncbi:2Fe-2S iron-sulfur cluster binding domain-containing protein [Paracoccus limosus]|jgi:2Fe-2S ferredoxin|uniref:2Fe-2S iron-sulfur cluster binding domain-containing protein n=1 Tax=Paracoccus limosus TaxID=913252 RepID=A0A844H978_9RHOB|nr:2Fe-2S iron-sulfur cluster-binding protein [Paracoccus limosus]MTH35951.1 2Fe-2S iron-sulfur cluster binding domain-containing protein [Paracoccus limosus]
MKITFIAADGTTTEVEAKEGDSVMHTAVQNDVDGIIGECGGSMMCATCHCYVDEAWAAAVGGQEDGESDLLDCAASEVKPTSRLSCQIRLRRELDGLVIHLPESQL